MAKYPHKDFCYCLVAVAPAPAASGTTMTLLPVGGATFPAVPFVMTVYPTGTGPLFTNAENVLVTAMVGNVVTAMTRAIQSTNARTIVVGDQVGNTFTQQDFDELQALTRDFANGIPGIVANPGPPVGNFLRDDNTFQPVSSSSGTGLLISSFPYFGTATLNDVFGGFTAPAVCQIERIQIAAQTAPSGADINVTLVDGGGVSLGAIGVLSDGSTYEETVLGAPLVLAPGDIVRAKLTAVDGTGGYLAVNLL